MTRLSSRPSLSALVRLSALLCLGLMTLACGRLGLNAAHQDGGEGGQGMPSADASQDSGADGSADAAANPGADASIDGGADAAMDAGPDADADASMDAGPDADADASMDAGTDAGTDAGEDAAPPCTNPFAEICDGQDNDCDGTIDEARDTQPTAPSQLCGPTDICLGGVCTNLDPTFTCTGYQELGKPYALCTTTTDWATAEANCVSMGGHLAGISSQEEQNRLLLVADVINSNIWIGGVLVAGTCDFEWVNGEPFGFTAWAPGEPNTCPNQDCIQLRRVSGLLWDDNQCRDERAYLCEWPAP